MLIGIDGNEANTPQRVGVGQYAYQLLKHIYLFQKSVVSYQKSAAKIRFAIYLKNKPIPDLPSETAWWKYKIFGPKKLWTQFALPFRLFIERDTPDVFFSPSHYSPRFSPCPTVMSVMDLSFVHFPSMFNKNDLHQLMSWTSYSIKRAKKVFTISNFTKKAIIEYYKIPESKIVVTYPGYDENKFKVKSQKFKINRVRNKYKIKGDYILFVGTLQPRKNIVRLIEAYKKVKDQDSRVKSIKLVIAGKKGWLYYEIFKKVKELRLENEVIITGYVEDGDLPDLYKGARCLVLPSLYEGFGLPLVEAMACGCPVVVSNVSSLPEIAGSEGILVDPYKVDDITKGILRIINFKKRQRKDMIDKGIKQARKYSWRRCAKKTLEVFMEIGSKRDQKEIKT